MGSGVKGDARHAIGVMTQTLAIGSRPQSRQGVNNAARTYEKKHVSGILAGRLCDQVRAPGIYLGGLKMVQSPVDSNREMVGLP